MKSLSRTILALAPGKREFGIAVFNGIELSHFSLRTLQNRKSQKLLKNEIIELIQEHVSMFQPHAIVVKAISQYQTKSNILESILKIIKREADARKVQWAEVTLDQVKTVLCNVEKPTQKKAFENLTVLYPELMQFADRPNKWQNDYYHNLFSAVSVGVVFLRSLPNSN